MSLLNYLPVVVILSGLCYLYKKINEMIKIELNNNKIKKPIIISIDGNIGSGKSTLVKILQKKLSSNVVVVEEPVNLWQSIQNQSSENILDLFYKDNNRWAYTFQNMAFITRTLVLCHAINKCPEIILVERSTETDKHVFAKCLYDTKKMSKMEYELYLYWYNKFNHKIDGFIYLQTDPSICIDRIKTRNRECETNIEYSYIQSMEYYHDQWLLSSDMNSLILDGNSDFITNNKLQEAMVDRIVQYTNQFKKNII